MSNPETPVSGGDSEVHYEVRDAAAWITLNRPAARNALSLELLDGVGAALDAAAQDPAVRAVVIGATGTAFCAGADLKRVGAMDDHSSVVEFLKAAAALFDRITEHPQPVIAAVQGIAVAGGLELVLACDLVIATTDAAFSDGHARYGLFPAAGGATRLPRKIGPNRAKQLLFTAESWTAQRMYEAGLVTEVAPADELGAAVGALVERIARHSPLGITGMKRLVDNGSDQSLPAALAAELEACTEYARSTDFAEGLRAFGERREPKFVGA
ncbi:enoyl-CoA hydratase [Mycolicibacterium chitae]|uniref:Enoyl-CoA hydratase/isomerase n=1 Tax=Mycolicibacterium chitae TaxID=1792 RepID=A0A448I7G5_MYCCI|nr:enoyl-CoA hydratase/isomerase family protein [Mycolicibacterium chitae]MCV7109184.1 enoyl-CoA hydratase/isomerase family protein [Mycolicibacterium chitae]BBZ04802.1 enoyl-CoA hydratase [Mycolicibacterium chitae]VEG48428.1 enoyl-CoA hydratase/isomerase [Mycolicibacterium chitae]